MKRCNNCNLSFDDNKMFCKKCGKPLISEYQIEPKEVAKKTVLEDKIKADPLNIDLLHEYAQFLYSSLIFKDTISVSLKLLAINEKDGFANELLFESYLKLNMLKEASEFGKQLLLERPTDIFLLQELAEISGKLGNAHKETEYFTQILKLQPTNTSALLNKAHNLLEENQLEKAIEIFSNLHIEGQNDRITTIYAGINKALKADYKAAIKLLSPILSYNEHTKQNDINTNRGVLYLVYSLCQSSAGMPEIKQWAEIINHQNLKQNFHVLDEQTDVKIIDFIVNQSLNEITPSENAHYQFSKITETYLVNVNFTELNNSKIAELWYAVGNKQAESKIFSDAVNSFQRASDLLPNETKYKEKYAEYTNLFESETRKRKRKTNFIIAASIIGLIIIVLSIFAYKSFEEKSAFELAKNENSSSSYQTYLDKYPKGKYYSEAQHLQEEVSWAYAKNLNTVESYDDFISHYGNSKHFQEAYNMKEEALWVFSKKTKNYSNYMRQYPAGKYIKEIRYDVPDIERIKSDLIGQQIPGWRFAYLNEFKSAEIINSTKGNNRIEYQLKLNLIDNTANSEHDCEIILVYLLSDQGWYFNNLTMIYITFNYQVSDTDWTKISTLKECNWSAENIYKLSWKTSDWSYGGETITGPELGHKTLPYSETYYIKSLMGKEIKVKFTYKPKV
ncbi:MAG: hypothetical protein M0Q53_19680 [Prolixibacteraceae bacterium]|jgi:hypothetical protein|nr:hypothetical protein [Prolixibacteraceae bacterium]